MNRYVVSTEPTSTMNITGLRIIVRGFSFLTASTVADLTIAGSKIDFDAGCLAAHLRRALVGWVAVLQSWSFVLTATGARESGPARAPGRTSGRRRWRSTPATSTPNSGVWVGSVPLVAGTFGLAASEPPIGERRDDQEEPARSASAMPCVTVYHWVPVPW